MERLKKYRRNPVYGYIVTEGFSGQEVAELIVNLQDAITEQALCISRMEQRLAETAKSRVLQHVMCPKCGMREMICFSDIHTMFVYRCTVCAFRFSSDEML